MKNTYYMMLPTNKNTYNGFLEDITKKTSNMKKINLEHLSSAKSEAKRIINPVLTGPQVA